MPSHEHETDPEGRQICTTSGAAPSTVLAEQTEAIGQHKGYIVLCEEERRKGFVRPYRDAYRHVGPLICGRNLSSLFLGHGSEGPCTCNACQLRAITCYMDKGHKGKCGMVTGPKPKPCRSVTTMGRALSETYARDPSFYGATFCCQCNKHLPVAEFVWTADGERVGS